MSVHVDMIVEATTKDVGPLLDLDDHTMVFLN